MDILFSYGLNFLGIIYGLMVVLIFFSLPKSQKTLVIIEIYLLVNILTDIISSSLAKKGLNNLFIIHIYSLIEFLFIGIIFYNLIKNTRTRTIVKYATIIGSIFIILNSIFIQDFSEFNSYANGFASFVIIVYSLLYFSDLLNNPPQFFQESIIKWIMITVFIYHCISIIALLFSNYLLLVSPESMKVVFFIRLLVAISVTIICVYQFLRLVYDVYFKKQLHD